MKLSMKPSLLVRPLALVAFGLVATHALAGDPTNTNGGPDGNAPRWEHKGPPGIGGGGMYAHLILKNASTIGLSSEQVETIKGFVASARPASRALHEKIHAQMELMHQTTPGSANYTTVVTTAANTIGQLTTEAITQEGQLRAQIWGVLTTQQQASVTKLEANIEANMKQWRQLTPPPAN